VGQYAYVVVVVPGNPAHADLMIVDLRQPAAPVIAGRVTVASAGEPRVVGSIAFIPAGTGGVQLVNVANPAAPAILGMIDTPGTAKGVALSGNHAFVAAGSAVVVEGTRLYVLDGLQLRIVDVANPAAPVLRSTTNAFAAHGVAAAGSFAFLASPDVKPAVNQGGLYVLDVSNPTAPRVLTNLVGGHDNWGVGVVGNIGVVAGNSLGLKVVDVATPAQPRVIGALAGIVKGATMAGQYAYIVRVLPGNPGTTELAIVDLRVPSSPVITGRVPVGGTNLVVDGSFAYV